MAQSKVNRELAYLGADLTSTNMIGCYAMLNKSKSNSPICGTGENKLIQSQIIPGDDNKRHYLVQLLQQVYCHLLIITPPVQIIARIGQNRMLLPPQTKMLPR